MTGDRLVAVNILAELLLNVIPGEVWGIVPNIVVGWAIDLLELLLGRVDPAGCVACGVTCDVSKKDLCIVKKLAELSIKSMCKLKVASFEMYKVCLTHCS